MGANMADGSIAASSLAGGKTLTRSDSAATRSRADALRQFSSSGSHNSSFGKAATSVSEPGLVTAQPAVAEPGNGMLSTSAQLILAETRTQEGQSTFANKSTLDKALSSYNDSQTSVRETMSLSILTARATEPRTGETSA